MAEEFSVTVVILFFFLCLCTQMAVNQPRKKIHSLNGILQYLKKDERSRVTNVTVEFSGTRYMLNLYESLETNDNSHGFNVSNVNTTKQVDGADTIMGILNDATDNDAKTSNVKMKLKFNFTADINQGDSAVELAELHLFKNPSDGHNWMSNATFRMELSVVTIAGNPSRLVNKLVDKDIQGWQSGWHIFDITSTVDMWIVSPTNNLGLELSVILKSQNKFLIPVNPSQVGFVGFDGALEKRPFIVSFFKGDPTDKGVIIPASSRKKRSVFNPGKLQYGNRHSQSECRKRYLYVDFSELRWENWIIAPAGYETSYCAGECTFSSYNDDLNVTNHAILQSVVNIYNPDSAPAPCCAPMKLKAISVLYYDNKSNVVLKKFRDMAVTSCGCH